MATLILFWAKIDKIWRIYSKWNNYKTDENDLRPFPRVTEDLYNVAESLR